MENEQTSLSWSAHEYEWKERSVDWFWTIGLIAIAVLVGAVLLGDTLFGILLALGLGLIAYLSIRKPEIITVVVNEKGILIGENFLPYKKLKHFYVAKDSASPSLLLMTDRFFIPMASVPLEGSDPDIIREYLLPHLEEKEMEESRSHKILERFGL